MQSTETFTFTILPDLAIGKTAIDRLGKLDNVVAAAKGYPEVAQDGKPGRVGVGAVGAALGKTQEYPEITMESVEVQRVVSPPVSPSFSADQCYPYAYTLAAKLCTVALASRE